MQLVCERGRIVRRGQPGGDRGVGAGRPGADLADPQLAAGEGSEAIDGFTRAASSGACRSNCDNVRSAQSAAQTASTRRSSSLRVKAPGWRFMAGLERRPKPSSGAIRF